MLDPEVQGEVSVETLLGQAADAFTQALDRGEQPDIEAYARQYPRIAAVVRQVFPALQVIGMAGAPDEPSAGGGVSGGPQALGCLGDYRIIREIGRGGMGVVYEAEQLSLKRHVALKVLPFAAVLDSRQLERFKKEAQAAAHLHHTNIVPVFNVGCERGVHYYAMQYIEGQPLSAVIHELRHLSGLGDAEAQRSVPVTASQVADSLLAGEAQYVTPRAGKAEGENGRRRDREKGGRGEVSESVRLSISSTDSGPRRLTGTSTFTGLSGDGSIRGRPFYRSVAELGVQAAEALQHAHDSGVVHRDIKPSNLLLDLRRRVWVTDFGLALVQTDPGLTMPGDVLGTLRYMSPEQALANRVTVDHRTDIYSLGATLYELLTLEPAFGGIDRQALMRRIAFEEPRPPRRVNPAIPRELETIVDKAMRKNPDERYTTAQAMADDLRRYLEDKPILAKPPTVADRLAKWGRRHRSVVAAAAVLLVMAVIGLSVSTVLVARARVEAVRQRDVARLQREQAEDARRDAESQRRLALANFRLARDAVNSMLTKVAQELEDVPRMENVRAALLADALSFYQQFLEENSEDPDVRIETGRAYRRVAMIERSLGDENDAEEALRQAIAIFETLAAESPDNPDHQKELAQSYHNLASLFWPQERYADAEPPARQAAEIWESLSERFPEQPEFRHRLAADLNDLAVVLRYLGRPEEAEALQLRCLATLEALAAEYPAVPDYRSELARCHNNLGSLLGFLKRLGENEKHLRQAVALSETLVAEFPDKSAYRDNLAFYLKGLGSLLVGAQRVEEAVEMFPRARLLQESLVRDFPSVPRYQERLADTHRALGDLLRASGRLQETEQVLRQAGEVVDGLSASFPDKLTYRVQEKDLKLKLAHVLEVRGERDAAEAAYRGALGILDRLIEDFPEKSGYVRDYAYILRDSVGRSLLERGRPAEAEPVLREALELLKRPMPDDPRPVETRYQVGIACRNVAVARAAQGDASGAVDWYSEALEIIREVVSDGPNDAAHRSSLGLTYRLFGDACETVGRLADAEDAYRAAIGVYDQLRPEFSSQAQHIEDLLASHILLERVLQKLGRTEEALEAYRTAAALRGQVAAQLISWAKESPEGVARAIEHARSIEPGSEGYRPFDLLVIGGFLTMGDEPDRAADVLQRAVDEGGQETAFFKSLGLALFAAGRPEEGREILLKVVEGFGAWPPETPDKADPDHWTAAWFLDLVTQEQFTTRWRHDSKHKERFAPLPWFYVGQRLENEGRSKAAMAAYEQAVELGKLPSAHHSTHYAAYRLEILRIRQAYSND